MEFSSEEYILSVVKKPTYSEMYFDSVNPATQILSRSFPNQKVALIFIQQIYIVTPPAGVAATVTLTDNYSRTILVIPTNCQVQGMFPFIYFIQSSTINLNCNVAPGTVFGMSIGYQIITEGDPNNKKQ